MTKRKAPNERCCFENETFGDVLPDLEILTNEMDCGIAFPSSLTPTDRGWFNQQQKTRFFEETNPGFNEKL